MSEEKFKNVDLLEIAAENLINTYKVIDQTQFNKEMQREIQKAGMKTGDQVLLEKNIDAEIMGLNYKLSHIKMVKNIIEEMEEEVQNELNKKIGGI